MSAVHVPIVDGPKSLAWRHRVINIAIKFIPQFLRISVAFDDQGEIVPSLGITVNEFSKVSLNVGLADKILFNLSKFC